ncbi:MAG: trigger factor [Anaerolineales bacterium]|nr:trigger factor [Anaerolineales bacterium]MCX7609677.1 trigger factor [Anaerolineales bacterium]
MNIELQPQENHHVTIKLTLEAAQLESAKRRAARRLSELKSVPGFRPGKAPYQVVVRTVGEEAVLEEAIDILLDEIYPQALKEAKIEPAAPGILEKIENLDSDPVFTFSVPLAPEVELGEYRSVRIPYEWTPPEESAIDNKLMELQRLYAKTETVDRPIQEDDFVLIDLKGKAVGAEESEEPLLRRDSMPIFVHNKELEHEWPYPGFNRELLGARAGEIRSFIHQFPEDHPDERLKGRSVQFEASIRMVRGSILPELNDDFAKQVGPFENIEALRSAIHAELIATSQADYDDKFLAKALDTIREKAVIRYAPETLEHELAHVREDFEQLLARRNLDLETYLKMRNMDQEAWVAEEIRPLAQQRLERRLLLDEIRRREQIQLNEAELQKSFDALLFEMQGDERMQKYLTGKAKIPKQLMEELSWEAANRALIQLTLERIKAIVTGQAPEADKTTNQEETKTTETTAHEAGETEIPSQEQESMQIE